MNRIATVLALAAIGAMARGQFFDDFNRADSATLGPNWEVIGAGSATRVISNQAGNVTVDNNLSLVQPGLFQAHYTVAEVTTDIFHSGLAGTGFVALAFGHNGSVNPGNGLYIKVQTQSGSSLFTHVAFYTGVGSSSTNPWTQTPVFFELDSEFSAARMKVWASDATTIHLSLDTNFNGIADQTYSRTLNPALMTFGERVGLGVYGSNVRADDFQAVPEPLSVVVVGLGVALLSRRRKK
jgi:hypothetical protein